MKTYKIVPERLIYVVAYLFLSSCFVLKIIGSDSTELLCVTILLFVLSIARGEIREKTEEQSKEKS